jgi:hypothetical protein
MNISEKSDTILESTKKAYRGTFNNTFRKACRKIKALTALAYAIGIASLYIKYKIYHIDILNDLVLEDVFITGAVDTAVILFMIFACYLFCEFILIIIDTILALTKIKKKYHKWILASMLLIAIGIVVIPFYQIINMLNPVIYDKSIILLIVISFMILYLLIFYTILKHHDNKNAGIIISALSIALLPLLALYFIKKEINYISESDYSTIELYQGDKLVYSSPDSTFYIGETYSYIYLLEDKCPPKQVRINKKDITITKRYNNTP